MTSPFNQISEILKTINQDNLALWELQLEDQALKTDFFSGYCNDIKDFPKTTAIFTMDPPDYYMNLKDICSGLDAGVGVDIHISREELIENLGSIQNGETERPKPIIKEKKVVKKKKKNRHTDGIIKSKSVVVDMSKLA